jgi:hypothetical protein
LSSCKKIKRGYFWLIVGYVEFVVGLRMITGGADLWGLLAVVDVSAVQAVPFNFLIPLEDGAVLDVLK